MKSGGGIVRRAKGRGLGRGSPVGGLGACPQKNFVKKVAFCTEITQF